MSKVITIKKGMRLTHFALASQLSEPQEDLLDRLENEQPLHATELRLLVEHGSLTTREIEEWDECLEALPEEQEEQEEEEDDYT